MRAILRFALVAAAALLALLLAAPRRAEAQAVGVEVRTLRKTGVPAKLGAWTWLAVDVENKTGMPLEGVLRASRGASFKPGDRSPIVHERRVSLPPRTRRVERLLYFCREPSSKVSVGFFEEARPRDPLGFDTVDVATSDDFIALVVSREDAAYGLFRGALVGNVRRREVAPISLAAQDLPDRPEAYEAVDALLLADFDARGLSAAQGEAIQGFVEAGGQLVVCFGGNRTEYQGTALEGLLPVEVPDRVEALATPALAAFGNEPPATLEPAPLVAAARPRAGASVVLREGAVPLIVRRRAGAGHVTWLAVDPTRRPLRGSTAGPGVVSRLLGASDIRDNDGSPFGSGEVQVDPFEGRLASLARGGKEIAPPPFTVVGALLAGYVLLVVPFNYGFWRRRNRAERAAPTAAVLGLLAGGAVYGIGVSYKGRAGLLQEIVLLDGAAGDARGREIAWCGIYAAERRLSRIDSPLAAAPSAIRSRDASEQVDSGRAATIRLDPGGAAGERRNVLEPVEIDQWSVRPITARGPAAVPVVDADLAIDQGRVVGSVKAPPETALRGAFVIAGSRVALLGDVERGGRREVSSVLYPLERGVNLPELDVYGFVDRDAALAIAARRPSLPAGEDDLEAVLVAAADPDPKPAITVDFAPPRNRAVRVLVLSVGVKLAPDRPVSLVRGLVRPRITRELDARISPESLAGMRGVFQTQIPPEWRDERAYRIESGGYDVEFTLPAREGLDLGASQSCLLDLRFASDVPNIKAFVLTPQGPQQLKFETAAKAEIPDPGAAYDPRTGTIRVTVRLPARNTADLVFLEPQLEVKRAALAPRR